MNLTASKARLGVVALVLGGASVLAVASVAGSTGPDSTTAVQATASDDAPGDVSGPCDEAEHADDPRCAGERAPVPAPRASTSTTAANAPATAAAESGVRELPTVGGTVTYAVDGTTLTVVDATPAVGWSVEVEQSTGRELEVDFRSAAPRLQVNIEMEDGQVRERVRVRDDRERSGRSSTDSGSGPSGGDGNGSG